MLSFGGSATSKYRWGIVSKLGLSLVLSGPNKGSDVCQVENISLAEHMAMPKRAATRAPSGVVRGDTVAWIIADHLHHMKNPGRDWLPKSGVRTGAGQIPHIPFEVLRLISGLGRSNRVCVKGTRCVFLSFPFKPPQPGTRNTDPNVPRGLRSESFAGSCLQGVLAALGVFARALHVLGKSEIWTAGSEDDGRFNLLKSRMKPADCFNWLFFPLLFPNS